ncbi:hypothetical protein PoHVEF18_004514 [Penicillium ochrochloron]
MSSLPSPVPIILCGRRAEIGKVVSELLAPEFEGIHFITTNEAALADIPRLLKGEKPAAPDTSGVGTQNYSQIPRAVVFGRGYDVSEVEEFRKASDGYAHPVAWFAADPKNAPGPNDPPPGPAYAQAAASALKEKLLAWKDEGGVDDGIFLW